MDDNFDQILAGLPEKRSRSRLEPYGVLIHEMLRRRRTCREIARILLDRYQIQASISTIHNFASRWASSAGRGRKVAESRANQTNKGNLVSGGESLQITQEPMGINEIQKRIAALKSRPIPGVETNSKIFQYDPEQPLHLRSKSTKKNSE